MNRLFASLLILLVLPLSGMAQRPSQAEYLEEHYTKTEHMIPMRDGTELYTSVYSPKELEGPHPIILVRTCYSCGPYGEGAFSRRAAPSFELLEAGYIFVCQDVRGRYMSEGSFDNMRPQLTGKAKKDKKAFDESTDTYDTIDWLVENVPNNNGKVGMWGISYPGFYTAVGIVSRHPALKASVPTAPIADFYFDDFHHRGAFTLAYYLITTVFTFQKDGPQEKGWYPFEFPKTKDGYEFYLNMGPLAKGNTAYGEDAFFWNQIVEHPDYDEFWQSRNLLPHLNDIDHAVLVVGGWFDAEDLYGPLNIYQQIEGNNPKANNQIVMGPWSHGDWSWRTERQTIGYVDFGDNEKISAHYRKNVEFPFFEHHLKDKEKPELAEAMMFDTGKKDWTAFEEWPPKAASSQKLYFHPSGKLGMEPTQSEAGTHSEYVSDPAKPVPYTQDVRIVGTPRPYMTDDQRFASKRPDVLVFQTEPLEEDITLSGNMRANINFATSGTDADLVVKLIDVYPHDHPDYEHNPDNVVMGGYQQLVRGEIQRLRYQGNDFSKSIALTPNQITEIELPLQDVYHTFKKGHRIMVQVQSSWFPLFDRNPQTFVPNIYKAEESDFVKANMKVYHGGNQQSYLEVRILDK